MLFDWLVVGQIVPTNPAGSVRGPKYVVKQGKTPVLLGEEARRLLDSIKTETMVGLRDRAFIALLVYTFARVSAAVHMNVEDVYVQGKRTWVRLHEKGGKERTLPCHHELEEYLDAYMVAAGVDGEKGAPLFRTAFGKTGKITPCQFDRQSAWYMVKRRAVEAGILSPIACHSFRATGITQYLLNGGSLEKAQMMAAHQSPRTTKLYDRTNDQIPLDEVERILWLCRVNFRYAWKGYRHSLLGDQRIELFCSGQISTVVSDHLTFLDHVHKFDPSQGDAGGTEGFEPEHGPGNPLDGPVILHCLLWQVVVLDATW